MLKRLFKFNASGARLPSYEESKRLARDHDEHARARLASREDVRPEILYYLAEDAAEDVRRRVAANLATPVQAHALLARDEDAKVRCDLARKIARLVPDSGEGERATIQEMTIEVLEVLAQDQLPRVRQILAEELKHTTNAPRQVIGKLARDVELIVAAPILEYSPLLADDDLLEIINSGPVQGALSAISRRRQVSAPVADAIAETWDVAAVGDLLANPNAQIREETLDRIIERAPEIDRWHESLVRRPELSVRAMRRIAGFVAASLVTILIERHDLDTEIAKELTKAVRRRLEDGDLEDGDRADRPNEGERAKQFFEAGKINDEAISDELDKGARDFVIHALALKARLPAPTVTRIVESGSGKALTAMAWRAGLEMRTAMRLQARLAHISHQATVNARDGVDYPLSPEEMTWHLEYFTS